VRTVRLSELDTAVSHVSGGSLLDESVGGRQVPSTDEHPVVCLNACHVLLFRNMLICRSLAICICLFKDSV
jgi:hypothetical protein